MCLIKACCYLIYNDMGQGTEGVIMLELPEENSSGAVQKASPVPRQVLHPDLVSTQRRLKATQKMAIKAAENASDLLTLVHKKITFEPGPSSQPSSWLTLQARLMADILRG